MTKDDMEKVYFEIQKLYGEIDCRIEHGANSNGHLEYIRHELHSIKELVEHLNRSSDRPFQTFKFRRNDKNQKEISMNIKMLKDSVDTLLQYSEDDFDVVIFRNFLTN